MSVAMSKANTSPNASVPPAIELPDRIGQVVAIVLQVLVAGSNDSPPTPWDRNTTSNGSKITSLPSPTYSASGDLGWTLTSHSVSHAWVNSTHRNAYATGNYDFTQYVGGQPFRTSAGWVRVNVSYQGTWTCQSG